MTFQEAKNSGVRVRVPFWKKGTSMKYSKVLGHWVIFKEGRPFEDNDFQEEYFLSEELNTSQWQYAT